MKRNILFLMTDQLRGDCLGYAGHPDVKTPYLDTLAAEGQYFDLYRIKPQNFVSETLVAEGLMTGVAPFDINTFDPTAPYDPENPNGIHKYTIVIWLEGDDPECTNELIGSKIGMNFTINLLGEENEGEEGSGEGTGGEQGGETPGEGA